MFLVMSVYLLIRVLKKRKNGFAYNFYQLCALSKCLSMNQLLHKGVLHKGVFRGRAYPSNFGDDPNYDPDPGPGELSYISARVCSL